MTECRVGQFKIQLAAFAIVDDSKQACIFLSALGDFSVVCFGGIRLSSQQVKALFLALGLGVQ